MEATNSKSEIFFWTLIWMLEEKKTRETAGFEKARKNKTSFLARFGFLKSTREKKHIYRIN